jgi:methylenetetrahydrofolate reductase (NADPH)
MQVCELLRSGHYAPVMPHLTCVGSSRQDLEHIADDIFQRGYRNIMTLRGDPPKGSASFSPHPNGLRHAADLVGLLKSVHPEFCCGVAGYPEKHPEAATPEEDIDHLKRKLDCGADFVTTQLFFDNQTYFRYVERCRAAGIDAPIIPGLLPAVSLPQVRRITTMCGASLPLDLVERLTRAGEDADAASEAGIEWVGRQIEELLDQGAPGIHLYILNRARSGLALSLIKTFHQQQVGSAE